MKDLAKTLVQALLDGAILQKIHCNNDFLFGGTEYLFSYIQKDQILFESRGYILPETTPEERFLNLFKDPASWSICEKSMKDGFPYPWSNK